MRKLSTLLVAAVVVLSSPVMAKVVTGWIETAQIMPEQFPLRAKIDTGADHSSLNAFDIQFSTRAGRQWATFTITNSDGRSITIDKRVERVATIRRHQGKREERPVVVMEICLGGVRKEVQVNLTNRVGLKYQLLLGRSFLNPEFMVDPAAKEQLSGRCN